MILKEKDGKQRINLIISDEKNVLKNLDDWRSLKELVELLAVKELLDIRYLLMKLKFLEKKKLIISEYRDNKKVWKRV